jgi:hypothetical protein
MAPKRKAAAAESLTDADVGAPPAPPRRSKRAAAGKPVAGGGPSDDAVPAPPRSNVAKRSRAQERGDEPPAGVEPSVAGPSNDVSAGSRGQGTRGGGRAPRQQVAAAAAPEPAPAPEAGRVNARGVLVPFIASAGPDTLARIARGEGRPQPVPQMYGVACAWVLCLVYAC